MQTRRDLAKTLLGVPLAATLAQTLSAKNIDSKIDGVMVGAQSYSFRDRDLDAALAAYQEVGLGYCELWQGHLEPKGREAAKAWRTSAPESFFKDVRTKFGKAGVVLYAFNYSFRDEFSEEEIERGFKMAQWLGINKITASSNVDISPRVDKYAQKYKVYVGFHNHASMKPNEFSTPQDFATAMAGRSKYIGVNLDIGHATAAGWDPAEYLEQNHRHIVTLHLKDRTKNHPDGKPGANLPFGQGETKIKEVLQLLKKNKWQIPANIEYEYGKPGYDTVAEVKKCFAYIKEALA